MAQDPKLFDLLSAPLVHFELIQFLFNDRIIDQETNSDAYRHNSIRHSIITIKIHCGDCDQSKSTKKHDQTPFQGAVLIVLLSEKVS